MAELTLRRPGRGVRRPSPAARRRLEAPAVAHAVVLVAAFVLLVALNAHQWFQDDEWAFVADRSVVADPLDLLRPHNEHWSTLPILAYRGLVAVFGARTYLPYVTLNLLLHLGVVHLLWRTMRRCGVHPWVATALAGVLAVYGAGAENLFWAFQTTWHASLLLGLAHLRLVDHPGPLDRRDAAGTGLAVAGLMCSGVSITMVAVAGLAKLRRRGWRAALATVALPGAAYLAWFAAFGHSALRSDPTAPATLLRAPLFVGIALDATLEGLTGLPAGGAVAAGALLLWVAATALRRPERTAAAALVAGALLFLALAAVSRIEEWGLGVARWSRYLYVAGVLLLPALGLAVTDFLARIPARRLAVAAGALGLAWMLAHSVAGTVGYARAVGDRELADRDRLLAVAALGAAGTRPIEAKVTPNMELRHLLALRATGALPDLPLSPRARAEAQALLHVGMTAQPVLPVGGPAAPRVIAAARTALQPAGDGCVTAGSAGPAAQVALEVVRPGALQVTSAVGGNLVAFVAPAGSTDAVPRVRGMRLYPGEPRYLNIDLAGSWVTLGLIDGDRARLCGVTLA